MRCRQVRGQGQGQGLDLGWVGDLGWGGVGGVGAGLFLFYVLASLNVHMGMLMQSKLE